MTSYKTNTERFNDQLTIAKEYNTYDLGKELWSGAKDRWDEADWETRDRVFDRLMEYLSSDADSDHVTTMTEVNDMIWFECDDIFFPSETEDEEEDDKKDTICAIVFRNLHTRVEHLTRCEPNYVSQCETMRRLRSEANDLGWEEGVDYEMRAEDVDPEFDFDDQPDWN